MERSPVPFNKIMLNITAPKGEGVSFNKGEMLKGLVQDVRQDGLVMLLIKGKLVEAASEVMVKQGQQLFLMVDDLRDGKTFLKVVTPQMMGEIENTNLSANLMDIGVQAKEDNIILAKKLLQHNLPVTQDNINNLARGLKILGGNTPQNLELTAFALSRGIDINAATLKALNEFALPGNDISKALQNLMQTVSRIAGQKDMPPDLSNQLRALVGGETAAVNAAKSITEQVPAQSSNAGPNELNVPPSNTPETQAKLVRLSDQATELSAGNRIVSDQTGQISNRDNLIKMFIDLIDPLLESMQINPEDSDSREVADRIRTAIKSEPEIIKGFELLKDILQNGGDKEIQKNPLIKEIMEKVDNIEKELTGQRLFNQAAVMPGENQINSYYFAFPVRIDNQYRLCQLKIDRDAGKKQLRDVDNINFVVSLETARLDLVLFHVNWRRSGDLQIQGVVENRRTCNYLNDNIDQLVEKLKHLGYRVNNLGIKIARTPEETNIKLEIKQMPEAIVKPFSIDVKV